MTREVGVGKLFVRVIVRPEPVGTVIRGGCQVAPPICAAGTPAGPVNAVHVTPPLGVPQVQPHIGTVLPSGSSVVCRLAVRLTDCAKALPSVRRKMVSANAAGFKLTLIKLNSIVLLPLRVTALRQ
jgi:hypothetical protein